MSEKLKVLELFGGIGACTAALKRIGIDVQVMDYVEIDKYAVASYNAINGTNFEPQDITKWDKDIEVDLLMHGSPCFVAGTKVLTNTGYKNIEDIKIGDLVLTHTITYQRVLKTGYTKNKQIYELKAVGYDDITEVTGNHPFYVFTNEGKYLWKEIRDIDVNNDKLCKIVDNKIEHVDVEFIKITDVYATVYNLEVETDNSYTANNFIVHNCQDFSISGKQAGRRYRQWHKV